MRVGIFRFLRTVGSVAPHQVRDELIVIAATLYENRPFLYLDIVSWLESKISGVPVREVRQRKFRQMK